MGQYHVYILASRRNGTLYVGMTSDLAARIEAHRAGTVPGFTAKYGVKLLVYVEAIEDFDAALWREKALKKWNRAWKLQLIEKDNPGWKDLADKIG